MRLFIFLLLLSSGLQVRAQNYTIIGELISVSNATGNTSQLLKRVDSQTQRPESGSEGKRFMMAGPVLYDQSELINYPGLGAGGANVSGSTGQFIGISVNISGGFALADEFMVPPGELWVIDSIAIFNYQTGSTTTSTINNLRMQLRKAAAPGSGPIVFGDLTTNRLGGSHFSGIYRVQTPSYTNTTRPLMKSIVSMAALPLSSGTYWIEHQVAGSLASGPFSPPRTLGTTHIATGNAYQFDNISWNQIFELDINGNNPQFKGIAFIVYGISLEDKAAEIGGVKYNTLQDAITAAAVDGTEILLLKDINDDVINVNNHSVVIRPNGFTCTIDQLNIINGEYLRWPEDTLYITGGINNNSSGIIWNNSTIDIATFVNTGIYKGTGNITGAMVNQGHIQPGN
ncbi:MAG: hypothetical protein IPN29_05595 [Saprospiraceae bacterium]|nr:hypothetical protein [Saprospiraceae bacterium]